LESDDYFPNLLHQFGFSEKVINSSVVFLIAIVLLFIASYLSANAQAVNSLAQDDERTRDDSREQSKFLREALETPRRLLYSISSCRAHLYALAAALVIFGIAFFLDVSKLLVELIIIVSLFALIILFDWYISRLFLRKGEERILRGAEPLLRIIYVIFRPITNPVTHKNDARQQGETASDDSPSQNKDAVDEIDIKKDMVRLYNKTADEIMVPRMDIEAIDIKSSFEEVIDVIVKTGFSRIPVYENSEDDIKGILYVKDMLAAVDSNETSKWCEMIRPAYFVPETKRIDSLFEEFRANKVHIAIVVDEFGCTSGLVTMEDIIEEIVGEIADEYDDDERHFVALPDGSFIFEGKIQLNDFFRVTNIEPDEFEKLTDEIDTLAGMLLKIKGTLPCRREIIRYGKYRFQVLEADERRVLKVKFSINKQPSKKSTSGQVGAIAIVLLFSVFGCASDYTPVPKPRGYFRIDLPEPAYNQLNVSELPYSFNVSRLAAVELPPVDEPSDWINVSYATLNAKIYCTFRTINARQLPEIEAECRELVSRTVKDAKTISEARFEHPENKVFGSLFWITGETASPIQFMLTDSLHRFFRGALYYQCKMDVDSLAPVNQYLLDDVSEMIHSFSWK